MVATTSQPPLTLDAVPVEAPDEVVLLDEGRRPVGTAPRTTVHGSDTPLHLAFSCYVGDGEGRVLLTRRALSKRTWPGVWTNSCCGHPRPGEPLEQAVRRRLSDELGLAVGELRVALPDFAYRATDASGVVENEFCPVFATRIVPPPHPGSQVRENASEVMEWRWVEWTSLVRAVAATPFAFSPWSASQVAQLGDEDATWV